MAKIILIRGLPGSGKSTLAKQYKQYKQYKHFEADQHFETSEGYKFDPKGVKDAHWHCQRKAALALHSGDSVVVSNTFTQLWELEAYYTIAAQYAADVQVIVCRENYGNIHGVPEEVIERMRARWED